MNRPVPPALAAAGADLPPIPRDHGYRRLAPAPLLRPHLVARSPHARHGARPQSSFDARCGWPGHFEPTDPAGVREAPDRAHAMVRTGILRVAHPGHVFDVTRELA